MKILISLLFLIPTNAYAAISNTGSGVAYSCTKEIGSVGTCTRDGAADCYLLGKSGLCNSDPLILECDLPPKTTCSCEWKQKVEDGSLRVFKDGFKIKLKQ